MTRGAGPGAIIGSGRAADVFDLGDGRGILSPAGPVVIDWSNAGSGAAAADVAQTWDRNVTPVERDKIITAWGSGPG